MNIFSMTNFEGLLEEWLPRFEEKAFPLREDSSFLSRRNQHNIQLQMAWHSFFRIKLCKGCSRGGVEWFQIWWDVDKSVSKAQVITSLQTQSWFKGQSLFYHFHQDEISLLNKDYILFNTPTTAVQYLFWSSVTLVLSVAVKGGEKLWDVSHQLDQTSRVVAEQARTDSFTFHLVSLARFWGSSLALVLGGTWQIQTLWRGNEQTLSNPLLTWLKLLFELLKEGKQPEAHFNHVPMIKFYKAMTAHT